MLGYTELEHYIQRRNKLVLPCIPIFSISKLRTRLCELYKKTTWIDLFCNSLQIEDSRKCSIRRKIEEYTVISR